MGDWISQQWNDIRGNVKFFVVYTAGGGVVSLVVAMTHGLNAWQQWGIALCFIVLFGWAVAATAFKRKSQHVSTQVDLLKAAPQLLIEYKPKRKNGSAHSTVSDQMEQLSLVNDSATTLKKPQIGRLIWKIESSREFNLLSAIGPIRGGQKVDSLLSVYERRGNVMVMSDLPDTLRATISVEGSEIRPIVEITYEDIEGHKFVRPFVLSSDPFGGVAWNPEPVRVAVGPVTKEN